MEKILNPAPLIFLLIFMLLPMTAIADTLTLHGAGSLKRAMSDVVVSFENTYDEKVDTKFGPSGLLRKAIEAGENPDIFTSANMGHPTKLESNNWGSPVVLFTRNKLCALAQPEVEVSSENFLETILAKGVKLGTSTPKADPSGDYAWKLFKRADVIESGNFTKLSEKALQLTGGPTSEKAPKGKNKYGWVMSEKKADVFLTYCTNAVLAQKEVSELQIVKVPEELEVGADYGLIVRNGAPSDAMKLALHILSPAGQTILADYGFEATAIPKKK